MIRNKYLKSLSRALLYIWYKQTVFQRETCCTIQKCLHKMNAAQPQCCSWVHWDIHHQHNCQWINVYIYNLLHTHTFIIATDMWNFILSPWSPDTTNQSSESHHHEDIPAAGEGCFHPASSPAQEWRKRRPWMNEFEVREMTWVEFRERQQTKCLFSRAITQHVMATTIT